MRAETLLLLSSASVGLAQSGNIGGAFGGDLLGAIANPPKGGGMDLGSLVSGGPDGGGMGRVTADTTGGSGPYKACFQADSSLPNHTIYAPVKVDPNMELPLIVWGNGACASDGSAFSNFLTEIASHGFMVIANGKPSTTCAKPAQSLATLLLQFAGMGQTKASMLTDAINWASAGAAAGKYGKPSASKIGTAGQSCGGLEAYSATVNDPRVKVIGLFNSGVVDDKQRGMVKDIKVPVGMFAGGATDGASANSQKDWDAFQPNLPVVMMNLGTGHMGTYFELQGGRFGKAAVAWFKWQLKDDEASKKKFFDSDSEFLKDGWKIQTKNWK